MKLAQRALHLKPSPTLALAAKAKELQAQGKDVISLSVGEPDWDTFDFVKLAAKRSIDEGFTKYTPVNGIPELREAIAQQTSRDFKLDYSPKQVSVASGGKFVIFCAIQVLCDPNDEVVIPSPYWVSYPTMVELSGAKAVIAECGETDGFKLSAAKLEQCINSRTKMLILNSPSNPTGLVYTQDELSKLAEVLRRHPQVMILTDDIYNRLMFSEVEVAPHILHVAPDLKDRVIVVNGCSKTYSMTGWRMGWALGDAKLIEAMANYQSQAQGSSNSFTQKAAVAAIREGGAAIQEAKKLLCSRLSFFTQELKSVPGFKVFEPQGAFYVWLGINSYLNKTWKGQSIKTSSDFAQALLTDQSVAVVPGVEFGSEGYLRLSFAINEKRLAESVARMKTFLQDFR